MKTPDVNVLVYAVNRDARDHQPARDWLEAALSGPELCGLTWFALTGFLRITTNRSILPRPLDPDKALDVAETWLSSPRARIIGPGSGHLTALRALDNGRGNGGSGFSDLHLAAIAIEHDATLGTFDSDFHRFRELKLDYLGGH